MINIPVTPIQMNSPETHGRSPCTPHRTYPWMQSIGERFAHLKVGRKIGYGYALALGVAALGASLGVLVGSRYQYQATMLEEQAQEEMQIISTLQTNLLESRVHQQKLVALVPSPTAFQQEYDELRHHADIVQQNWDTLRKFASESSHDHHAAHDHNFLQLQTTYNDAIESYFLQLSMLADTIQHHSDYSSDTSSVLQEQLLEFSNHPVVGQIDQLVNELNTNFEEVYEEYRQSEQHARIASQIQLRIILASAGVSIAIATALIYLTSRAIARPLETTTQIAQEVIQTGNFNLQIPITTQDEVGVLATSLNNLIQGFNHLLVEQKEAKDQLYNSQQLLKLVIDTLPQSIFWKDRNLVFLGCNQQLAQFAGMESPAELIGKTDYDLPWTDGEAHYLREGDRRVMLSNQAELGLEATYTTADGKFRWLEINKVPLHDADGTVIGVLGTFQDITERKEAELKLQHLNQVLEQRSTELSDTLRQLKQSQMQLIQTEKMSSLGQLVAGVAHEINNPINFIHGNLIHANQYAQDLLTLVNLYQHHYPAPAQKIQDEIDALDIEFLTTDLTRLLKSMRVGTDRIREIVLSLRTFSRLDEAEVKNVNLHEGIDSTLTILHHRLKENSTHPEIQIVKDYGALPLIECYAGQLNQVFMNLLSNAIDALEESFIGRPYKDIVAHPGQIRIRTELLDPDWVAIHIADNGPGMADTTRDRLFDPFFTTKPVGKGTGLGLSISHQIITDKHSGHLYCYSIPGKGTEFTIKLPTRRVLP